MKHSKLLNIIGQGLNYTIIGSVLFDLVFFNLTHWHLISFFVFLPYIIYTVYKHQFNKNINKNITNVKDVNKIEKTEKNLVPFN